MRCPAGRRAARCRDDPGFDEVNILIPKKIQLHFHTTFQKKTGENSLIEGLLTCCNDHDFEVFVAGEIKHSIFSNTYLFPGNDVIVLEARCKKCGKMIPVFDSSCDGYEHCGKKQHAQILAKPITCRKCRDDSFSVRIKYEYPDVNELKDLGIAELDNAFTWIWVTLECNKCGTKYKNFIDCETA